MTPDYSSALIEARRLLLLAEEAAALHHFPNAIWYTRRAKNEVEAMAVSLLLLGDAQKTRTT